MAGAFSDDWDYAYDGGSSLYWPAPGFVSHEAPSYGPTGTEYQGRAGAPSDVDVSGYTLVTV